MIRPATIDDAETIVDMAVESVGKRGPVLPVRRDKIAAVVVGGILQGDRHFFMVDECDGRIAAVLGALVHPGFWFDGDQANVMVFYSRGAPYAAGAALIRRFAAWIKVRPDIRLATFSLEPDADPRIRSFLQKLGFTDEHPQLAFVKR